MLQTYHFTMSQTIMTWLPWWPLVFPELIDKMVVAFLRVILLEVTSGRWVEGCPCSVSLIRQERAFKWFSSVINGPIEGHQQALHYYPKTTSLTLMIHNMMVLCIECVSSGKWTKVQNRHTCRSFCCSCLQMAHINSPVDWAHLTWPAGLKNCRCLQGASVSVNCLRKVCLHFRFLIVRALKWSLSCCYIITEQVCPEYIHKHN